MPSACRTTTMDQGTSTILAALIGALAGIEGARSLERLKHRQERHGVARALAGAIEFELWALERRGHETLLREKLAMLEAGDEVQFFGFAPENQTRNPIADAYTAKLGMLRGDLPARVIQFFQTMWGIRVDGARLVSGGFGEDPATIAGVLRQDLELLGETVARGRTLARDLRASADGFWWPIKRAWRAIRHRRPRRLEADAVRNVG